MVGQMWPAELPHLAQQATSRLAEDGGMAGALACFRLQGPWVLMDMALGRRASKD